VKKIVGKTTVRKKILLERKMKFHISTKKGGKTKGRDKLSRYSGEGKEGFGAKRNLY